MTKRGLPGPEGSREGRGAEEGHIPWLIPRPGPRLGEGGTEKPPRRHFPSALRFLGTPIVSGWVRLLCVKTTGFGHGQRRLVEGGQSQALGHKDSACCFQRLSQLSKWNTCMSSPGKTKFSGEQIPGRDTSGKVREGTRRHNIDSSSILPLVSFPRSNIPGEGKLEASILRGKKPRSSRLFGEYKLNFSAQPAASARPLCILDRGCPEMQRTGTSHASRVCPCSSALCHRGER